VERGRVESGEENGLRNAQPVSSFFLRQVRVVA
jgi:hypothetical protein